MKNNEEKEADSYTDEEINELAEWLEDLTIKQVSFLKRSYEGFLIMQAHGEGSEYVH